MLYKDLISKEKVNIAELSNDAQYAIKEYEKEDAKKGLACVKKDGTKTETTQNKLNFLNKNICTEIYNYLSEKQDEADAKKAKDEADAKKAQDEADAKKAKDEADAKKAQDEADAKKAQDEADAKKAQSKPRKTILFGLIDLD